MEFDIIDYGFCVDKTQINLDSIPIIERRKMSLATKFIYTSIAKLDIVDMPLVFATNLGEINRCIDLLSELSRNGIVSPNSFSMSVLNAPVANIAIQRDIHNEIIALSSNSPVESATISALSKLKEYKRICVIAYEESYFDKERQCVAFIISSGGKVQLNIGTKNPNGNQAVCSTKNFIENFGSDFCFFDESICYEWKFSADS